MAPAQSGYLGASEKSASNLIAVEPVISPEVDQVVGILAVGQQIGPKEATC